MSAVHKVTGDGDHQLGATVDGVFVAFVTVPAFIVAQKVEAAQAAAEQEKADKKKGGN